MDYSHFGQILIAKGIDTDPAWDDLKVLIAPLPNYPQNPLGLYYPDGDPGLQVPPGTIWIPPDANDDTALHELGHRFYHFYHDDVSEPSAENFRYKYRKVNVPNMRMAMRSMILKGSEQATHSKAYKLNDYQMALIQEQLFAHGEIYRDPILYADVRYPV